MITTNRDNTPKSETVTNNTALAILPLSLVIGVSFMRFRKIPVEIDAIQWTGGNLKDCIDFLGNSFGGHKADRTPNGKSEIMVLTLEGHHIASKGDWLIRGVNGEHYPCKPDIFEKTYEAV